MNENYYIYKLARQQEKTSYHFYDVVMGDGVSSNAVYYGLTQDPQSRLSKHRPKKGHDISLIVIAVVAQHYRKYKGEPELQGMANTGHRRA